MPLSDDELNELEAHYQNDRVGFDILALQRNDKGLSLIAELRAARKVVEAARAFMDAGPSVAYYDARLGLPFGDGPEWEDDLKGALAEYDAAGAEPQKQRSG